MARLGLRQSEGVTPMAFVPENDLERALAAAGDENHVHAFYRQLFDSPLFVLGDIVPLPMQRGREMRLFSARNADREYHVFFTSLNRLRNFAGPNDPFVHILGRELFTAVPGRPFFVNPGTDKGRALEPDEIARMLAAFPNAPERKTGGKHSFAEGSTFKVFLPEQLPAELVEALSTVLRQDPDVLGAHLVLAAFEAEEEAPHFVLGIETTGDFDAIASAAGNVAMGLLPNQLFDVTRIARDRPDDGLIESLLKMPPFYTRQA
jgi:hypothetical protein